MSQVSPSKASRIDKLLLSLLALSLLSNLVIVGSLVWRRDRPTRTNSDVKTGDTLKSLEGSTLSGVKRTIDLSTLSKPLVLYVFSESCVWCQRNSEAIRLLARTASNRFDFMGIAIGDTHPSQLEALGITFPVLVPSAGSLPFRSTPQTVVLERGGRIVSYWSGAYGGANKKDIENYFAISLPQVGS